MIEWEKQILPGTAHCNMGNVCPVSLGSHWLVWRKFTPSLPADVIIAALYLPGELGNRCGLAGCGSVEPTDVVAVLGRVILHSSGSAASVTSELQDREDSAKFTHHPVLEVGVTK